MKILAYSGWSHKREEISLKDAVQRGVNSAEGYGYGQGLAENAHSKAEALAERVALLAEVLQRHNLLTIEDVKQLVGYDIEVTE